MGPLSNEEENMKVGNQVFENTKQLNCLKIECIDDDWRRLEY